MLNYELVLEGLEDVNCSVEQARQLLKQYEEEMYSLKETIATMGLEVVNDKQADEIILLKAVNLELFNTNKELIAEVKELLEMKDINIECVKYWRVKVEKMREVVL